jgi:hypothetical protein
VPLFHRGVPGFGGGCAGDDVFICHLRRSGRRQGTFLDGQRSADHRNILESRLPRQSCHALPPRDPASPPESQSGNNDSIHQRWKYLSNDLQYLVSESEAVSIRLFQNGQIRQKNAAALSDFARQFQILNISVATSETQQSRCFPIYQEMTRLFVKWRTYRGIRESNHYQ